MNTLEIANATRSDEIAPRIPSLQSEIPFGGVMHPISFQQRQLLSPPVPALFAAERVDFTQQQALSSMYVPSAIPSTDADQILLQDKEHNSGQVHAATLDNLANIALSRN